MIDLDVLFEEIDGLAARGVDASGLLISANAHLIASYHQVIDKVTERFLGKRRIGTTGRGVGPAYADKVNRIGLRVQDLFDPTLLAQKVEASLEQKNHLLVKVYNRRAIDPGEVTEHLLSFTDRVAPHVTDVSKVLNDALDSDGIWNAIRNAGLDLPERPHTSDLDGKLVNVFLKCEADPTGYVRGRRNAMLDDSDVFWHRQIKATVGGVAASVTGDPAVFVSVAAVHQGPSGGGPVAAIISA